MASNTTHASEVLGRKAISIKWPSSSTDHNRGFGPGVRSFEARIADIESCPQLPFGRKRLGAWAPNFSKFLRVILGDISEGEGVCLGTRGRQHYLVCPRSFLGSAAKGFACCCLFARPRILDRLPFVILETIGKRAAAFVG